MFFWHWIIVQWIERNRIYFAVLRMWKPTNCSQFNFALFRSFWYIFPHRHGCYAFSKYNSFISTQNHNQPATTLNWAKLDTFQACEICLFSLQLFDWNAAPETCTRSPMQTHFPSFFFILKSKGKRTPSHPTVSLVRMRRVSCDTFEREKDNGFETCAKFYIQLWNWMIFLQTISIIRKCYPSLFAHFHNTLLHIILIFPRLWFKKTHLGTHWKEQIHFCLFLCNGS